MKTLSTCAPARTEISVKRESARTEKRKHRTDGWHQQHQCRYIAASRATSYEEAKHPAHQSIIVILKMRQSERLDAQIEKRELHDQQTRPTAADMQPGRRQQPRAIVTKTFSAHAQLGTRSSANRREKRKRRQTDRLESARRQHAPTGCRQAAPVESQQPRAIAMRKWRKTDKISIYQLSCHLQDGDP
jgi:hypothetical protein